MQIVIATGLYAPDIGGPATYVAMLERHLPQRGYTLKVVSFRDVRGYPKVIRHIIYAWRVWRQARSADMIYALDPISVGLPALVAATVRRKKLLLRLGGDYAWEQGRQRFGVAVTLDEYTASPQQARWPVRCLAYWQTVVARRAALVIAPSEYLKGIIVSWGVSPDRVQVIYSSLVPITPSRDKVTVRADWQLSGPVISTAGRLVPWKGIRALIAVVDQLRERGTRCHLIIAGDGPEETGLKQYVRELELESQVRFLGRLTKVELANMIVASDVFVLNTAYEGLSHQLLEVMDLEVPIVTTTAGGNTELLTAGETAELVLFNDTDKLAKAVTKVFNNSHHARALTEQAKQRSQDFVEEKVIATLDTQLKTVYAS